MLIKGVTGEVRWSYLPAVVFGPWTIETTSTGGTLDAEIVSCDAYRAAQTPLNIAVRVGRQTLTFPVEQLDTTGPRLTAVLGPRLREIHAS